MVLLKGKNSTEHSFDISIVPPYSFRNALPCPVRFRRHGDSKNELLNVGEHKEIYASCNRSIFLELILPGYVSSIFQFNSKDNVTLIKHQ